MIELIITTVSILGWFVSIYCHPRISECLDPAATAIDEAPASYAHPPPESDDYFVVSDAAVGLVSRARKGSRSSDDLSGLDQTSLPRAVIVGPEDAAAVRGFGTLVLSDSTAEMAQ